MHQLRTPQTIPHSASTKNTLNNYSQCINLEHPKQFLTVHQLRTPQTNRAPQTIPHSAPVRFARMPALCTILFSVLAWSELFWACWSYPVHVRISCLAGSAATTCMRAACWRVVILCMWEYPAWPDQPPPRVSGPRAGEFSCFAQPEYVVTWSFVVSVISSTDYLLCRDNWPFTVSRQLTIYYIESSWSRQMTIYCIETSWSRQLTIYFIESTDHLLYGDILLTD